MNSKKGIPPYWFNRHVKSLGYKYYWGDYPWYLTSAPIVTSLHRMTCLSFMNPGKKGLNVIFKINTSAFFVASLIFHINFAPQNFGRLAFFRKPRLNFTVVENKLMISKSGYLYYIFSRKFIELLIFQHVQV